jgi:nucleoside-diphosphate-sugar epimerase
MNHNDWKDESVLVTGGAGFLGSHLVEALVSRGARVSVLDCMTNPVKLANVQRDINYIRADIADWSAVGEKIFKVIFHLAAFSSPSAAQGKPDLAFRQNVMGTINLLQTARRACVEKFVFTSAGALYTNVPKYLPMDEKHPIDPTQSVYAMTKRIGELLCEDFQKNFGVRSLYFRLFNTYGPRQSGEYLIPSFVSHALAKKKLTVLNGAVRRDFTCVYDTVEALLKGAKSEHCGGPINVGSGIEHSIADVAAKIGALLNVEVECLNEEVFGPTRQVCDNTLAKTALQWRPFHTLDEGLRITVPSLLESLS